MDQRTCAQCAEPLAPNAHGRRKFCSRLCNEAAQVDRARERRRQARAAVVCLTCGASLADRRATRFCSRRCNDIHRGMVRAEPLPEQECELPDCTVRFVPHVPHQRCCSHQHVGALWRLENPDKVKAKRPPWDDKRRAAYHKRRALKMGASTGRPVIYSEIADRDAWGCHLCGRPVSRDLAYPDPMSGSLDHVVPLSKGGSHDPINVRLAHLYCNVSKGNREAGDRLPLLT